VDDPSLHVEERSRAGAQSDVFNPTQTLSQATFDEIKISGYELSLILIAR
jgi:hypothetical protein